MKFNILIFLALFFWGVEALAQHIPSSKVCLADIRIKEGNIYFGAAKTVSEEKGYNNQPYFLNDSTLLYTHMGDDLQTDIYAYFLKSKKRVRYTQTGESEYSAGLTPRGNAISVVEVEQDSSQRIWCFDLNGNNGKVLIPHFDSVGYYAWISDTLIAAFVLTSPPSLQLCSTTRPYFKKIDENIGRCLQVAGNRDLYFTKLESDSVRWLCKYDQHGAITKLIEFYKDVEDYALSKQNYIFCAKGGLIYYTDQNFAAGWRLCGNFEASGLSNINRIALSSDNKKIALVEVISK